MAADTGIIVTIGRQIASGGGELARRVAQRLGFALIDREIVRRAAEHLGCPEEDLAPRDERVSGFWDRFLHTLALGVPESAYINATRLPEVGDAALFRVQAQAIVELTAGRNAVLIGHAGFQVLRGRPGLVKVFVHAPREFRLRRMASVYGISSPSEARAALDRTDEERQRFIREMAGVTWTDARNYDLCLDMSRTTFEAAEEMVAGLVEQRRAAISQPVL